MEETNKKNEQSGRIAKIYDQMIKEIMPLPQKPPIMRVDDTEMKPIEKSKEGEKKDFPFVVDLAT